MEKGEGDIMKRAPRNSRDGIFANGMGIDVAWQGVMVTIVTLAAYVLGLIMTPEGSALLNRAKAFSVSSKQPVHLNLFIRMV